ncbi:MFS transporter [Kibdelosporangium persicum]|uniref:Major facilitator superfamily (MFS) profile domain-containing protein n=1 Tax=Kibdelosporangium persicum TaxID=2698649 RepID=A0ABX2F7J8_9PSEU|nr:MFS transporter [Kibdelosporangium persicum]NRN66872.1 hypothetical protein [Kibdelosporangium persicum]
MSTPQVELSSAKANLALATLFLGMFVLGSAELLVVGVLNLIAADLNVSIPAAGTLVTAYALAPGRPVSSSRRSSTRPSNRWKRAPEGEDGPERRTTQGRSTIPFMSVIHYSG